MKAIQTAKTLHQAKSMLAPDAGLGNLQALVANELEAVNAQIITFAKSHVDLIPTIAAHLTGAGGKRLRPMLTLASAGACSYSGQHHIALATAVEFIHTATLLHDDVVDESLLRRGNATANDRFGNKASILVGDFLFAQAFRLMVQSDSLDALSCLSDASAVIAEGEVLQLQQSQNARLSEADYLTIIRAKTSALFAAACEVGAILANKPEWQTALHSYGDALGILFQIVDDLLDYTADQRTLGKTVGDDFREGKVTLPLILLRDRLNTQQKAQFMQWLEPDYTRSEAELTILSGWLGEHDIHAATLRTAEQWAATAHEALSLLPDTPYRDGLAATVDYCLVRVQ